MSQFFIRSKNPSKVLVEEDFDSEVVLLPELARGLKDEVTDPGGTDRPFSLKAKEKDGAATPEWDVYLPPISESHLAIVRAVQRQMSRSHIGAKGEITYWSKRRDHIRSVAIYVSRRCAISRSVRRNRAAA